MIIYSLFCLDVNIDYFHHSLWGCDIYNPFCTLEQKTVFCSHVYSLKLKENAVHIFISSCFASLSLRAVFHFENTRVNLCLWCVYKCISLLIKCTCHHQMINNTWLYLVRAPLLLIPKQTFDKTTDRVTYEQTHSHTPPRWKHFLFLYEVVRADFRWEYSVETWHAGCVFVT